MLNLSCSLLADPRMGRPFHMHVDASDAGAVLFQSDERPVSLFSKKFNLFQFNYAVNGKRDTCAHLGFAPF